MTLDVAEHATLRLSNTPGSDEAATSLFQKNMAAIKVLRYYAARRLTDDCVAIVDGVNYSGETA